MRNRGTGGDRPGDFAEARLLQAAAVRDDWLAPLADAMETGNDGVLLTNPRLPDNPIVYASERFYAFTGYRPDEVIGCNGRLLQGPASSAAETARIEAAIAAGRGVESCIVNYRRDGSAFLNALRIVPVLDRHNRLAWFVVTISDASGNEDRGRAAQRIAAWSQLAGEFFAEYTVDDDRLTWLGQVDRRMGYESGEFPRSWDAWLAQLHPDDAGTIAAAFGKLSSENAECFAQCRVLHRNGQYRDWHLRGIPELGEGDHVMVWCIVCDDVTSSQYTIRRMLELRTRVLEAREQERRHLAREIHDDISQRLAALTLHLNRMRSEADDAPETLQRSLRSATSQTRDIASEISSLARGAHPTVLAGTSLEAAMCAVVDRLAASVSFALHFDSDCTGPEFDVHTELTFYRVLQESLRNVVKHANAQEVYVTLLRTGAELHVEISDDGIGFDPDRLPASDGLGIVSMQERADLIGATLQIASQPGLGTTVTVRATRVAPPTASPA